MEFRLLGPLEVLDGETPVDIAGAKRKAVLALLVLRANEVVGSERLIDELWGEQAPRNAANALHTHVSRLRKALGPDLLARREWGYVLRAPPETIDLRRFELLLAEAEPLPARERASRLTEALKLWRGPALADLATEPGWLRTEIARLDELRLTTVERRIDADLEAGRNAELVGEIETLIAAHPLRERLRGQLILSLYRAGRQAEALEVYRETRRVLSEELGLEPSAQLKELEKAILRQDPTIALSPPDPRPGPAGETQPSQDASPPPRLKTPPLLLGMLGILVLGFGAAAAVALMHGNRSTAARTLIVTTNTTPKPTTQTHTRISPVAHRQPPHATRIQPAKTATTSKPAAGATNTIAVRHAQPSTTANETPSKPPAARPANPPQPATTTPSSLATISDNFDGSQIDGTIWHPIRFGTGWDMTEQNGHLEFSFTPASTPAPPYDSFGGLVGTQCKFPGDFDARVDFTLVDWPPGNGISVTLDTFLGPTNITFQSWRSSSAQWGEAYGSDTGTSASVALNDMAGTLRIARHNGTITAYFLHNGAWDALTSGRNTLPAIIGVSATGGPGYNNGRTFTGQQQVTVDFDNFTVIGPHPTCPAGSQPPGP